MLVYNLLVTFVALIAATLDALHLPSITALPTILGINLDTTLVEAVGYFTSFVSSFWPIRDLFIGVLFYISYLSITRIALRLALGARSPQ